MSIKQFSRSFGWRTFAAASILLTTGVTHSVEMMKIGIAQFGEVPQLVQAVKGFKAELAEQGYKSGVNVEYQEIQVNFDSNLIPQMITKLNSSDPKMILTVTTPVSQGAKRLLSKTKVPVFFSAVTDPVSAQLVPAWDKADPSITGASDLQDLDAVLAFIRKLMPKAKNLAVAYNPGEDNDVAQVNLLEKMVSKHGFKLVKLGIDNTNDIPIRVGSLRGKADVLYAPASSLIQNSMPAVGATARTIKLPLISSSSDAVTGGFAVGSYEVSYDQVGRNTGKLALRYLKGESISNLAPIKPAASDHFAKINGTLLGKYNLTLPSDYSNCNCVVK